MACAEKARERGFKVFGIQYYTECWSGPGGEKTFGRDGSSVDCVDGVGKSGANFVYRFGDYGLCETKFSNHFSVYQYDLVTINNWLLSRIVFSSNPCTAAPPVFPRHFSSDDGVWCEHPYESFESRGQSADAGN